MKEFVRTLFLTIIVCCWSCSDGGEDLPTPSPKPETSKIEISSSAPVVEQKGGTATITFTTNAAWTANVGTSTSWLKVSPTSGPAGTHTLTVTTVENDTYDERNASITIKAGNASKSITVTQKQKDGLTVTSNKVEIGTEGGNFSIEAKSNVSVTYEIEESAKEWISAVESRALTTKTLNFTAKANDKVERRQGNIIVKGGDGLTETVTVYQSGEEVSLVLTTPKDMTIGSEGGTLKIELESNTEVKMEALDADWLRQSSSRAMSAYTYYIEVDANETYDERNAAITFVSGDKKQIVTITQKQKDALIVTSNKVEIGAEGGNFSIEAKANVSVTYEIEESAKEWISAVESRALTTKTLNFTVKANDKMERRQGNIILKGGDGLTETVTVYQSGEKPTLVITTVDIIIGSEGGTIDIELKSNVEYTMTLPQVDWISKEESRAISAYTHYLTIAPNETYDQRNAVVYFQNETEYLKDSISITQLQKDAIIVAKNEYKVGAESCTLEFSVNTNVDFKVETSVDWIKQNTGSRALVEKPLSFTIAENDTTTAREGKISITFKDLKQTIKVTQKGTIDYEAIERAALIEFYYATDGDNWEYNTDWCSDKPVGEWFGIKTSESGLVQAIELGRNKLSGSIPESIGNLLHLKNINLTNNQLSGSIPESIGNSSNIEDLYLSYNKLSGSIPESFGNLSQLKSLWIDHNELSGSIPESFGNLSQLKNINLNYNKLSGSIPESIGNLSQLEMLGLLGNQLSGSIPESIGNLSQLWYLNLLGNRLSGNIPESIGNLSQLVRLELSENQLSGSIPESIGNLSRLEFLHFYYNQLSGSIPESIGSLSQLKSLNLQGNQLSGSIPESIGNLSQLEYIDFNNNQLSGSIPESIGNLSQLILLNLAHNQLSGNIPEGIGSHSSLTSLYIGNNQLSGKIPVSLMNWSHWSECWFNILIQKGEGFLKDGLIIPAPKFELNTTDGDILTDRIYSENEYTVLYHYFNWCLFSELFTSKLVNLYKEYKNKGLEVIAFSSEASTANYYEVYSQKFDTQWPYILMENAPRAFLQFSYFSPLVNVVDKNGHIVFNAIHDNYNNIEDFLVDNLGEPDEDQLYTSTDYSRDGEVVTLQTASAGKGINLTFMGEAFVDKDMGDGGLYEQKMKESMEKFFSIEPYKSMRNRFNVYAVKVVSPNAEFTEDAKHRINLSDSICFEYGKKIPNADKNPMMVSVIYNTMGWVDRSYTTMYSDGSFVGYMMDGISNVLIHEAGGHGFANLLDEYVESGLENSTLPKDYQTFMDNVWETFGWGANVDWRNNASTVKWSHFLNDNRYANEGLGLYEGAYLYGYGAYRPTENSMMRYNDSPFNAPSREQIYKRIMQLSEGEGWKYDYEEFVKYDEINRNTASRSAIKPLTEAERREYIKNHRPPTFIKGTWRDAINNGKNNIVVPLR